MIRERIENNLIIFFLATLLTGFLAGIGTYEAILNIAHLKVISEAEYKNCQEKTVSSIVPPPPYGPTTIYQDNQSDINKHDIKFIELTAKSIHNPPRLNDQIYVEFTIQNVSDKSINILETYVTSYDPVGVEKSFAFGNKSTVLKPQEKIKTSGSMILDVPGIWEVGPHYALGKKWNGEQYPGHWKRFQIRVVE